MPIYPVPNWGAETTDRFWDDLDGAAVFCTPRVGEDLVVWAPPPHGLRNLGRITQVALESGSGETFLVRTDRFGDRGELFLRLAEGVRPTAALNSR